MNDNQKTSGVSGLSAWRLLLIGLLALGAGLLAFNLDRFLFVQSETSAPPATRYSTLIPAPRALRPFALTDHRGDPFNETRLLDRWTMLSFGYTHCPDVCPTGLAALARFADRLEQAGSRVPFQVVFVSIDPERDTPDRLATYVPYFHPGFIGATGEAQELQRLTGQLGIMHARVESEDSAMGYLMDHTASFILIDPLGRYHAVFNIPHDDAKLAHDFNLITARPVN